MIIATITPCKNKINDRTNFWNKTAYYFEIWGMNRYPIFHVIVLDFEI